MRRTTGRISNSLSIKEFVVRLSTRSCRYRDRPSRHHDQPACRGGLHGRPGATRSVMIGTRRGSGRSSAGRPPTAPSRTSWSTVEALIDAVDPSFLIEHQAGGVVSGEGLIELVRDGNGINPDAKGIRARISVYCSSNQSWLEPGTRHGCDHTDSARSRNPSLTGT